MGSLILCYKKKAKQPYEITRIHRKIYTIEELCYYLCNNLYLIDYTIMNEPVSYTHLETYYILSGNGVYVDNGEEIPAKEGDVFFCEDGDGHGLKNTGERDLVFVALILKK